MKLSDFLKQQGDTPQGKSIYQAFIDNFDKDYDAESFRNEKCSIAAAFQWDICPEDLEFWDIVDNTNKTIGVVFNFNTFIRGIKD